MHNDCSRIDFVSFTTELNKNPSTKENATNETAPPRCLLLKTIGGAKCQIAKSNDEYTTYHFEFASSISIASYPDVPGINKQSFSCSG